VSLLSMSTFVVTMAMWIGANVDFLLPSPRKRGEARYPLRVFLCGPRLGSSVKRSVRVSPVVVAAPGRPQSHRDLSCLLAVPLGVRTIVLEARIAAPGMRIWQALYPLGADAGWSGRNPFGASRRGGRRGRRPCPAIKLSWEGRDGQPIERKYRLSDVVEGQRYTMAGRR